MNTPHLPPRVIAAAIQLAKNMPTQHEWDMHYEHYSNQMIDHLAETNLSDHAIAAAAIYYANTETAQYALQHAGADPEALRSHNFGANPLPITRMHKATPGERLIHIINTLEQTPTFT